MKRLILELQPQTAFASPLLGCSLFGQLCVALETACKGRLDRLLAGYTSGQPFAVIGDVRPKGFFPRPSLPRAIHKDRDKNKDNEVEKSNDTDVKQLKHRNWTPETMCDKPVEDWLDHSLTDDAVAALCGVPGRLQALTTRYLIRVIDDGDPEYYETAAVEYSHHIPLKLDVWVDERRLAVDELLQTLRQVGWQGYGGGASRGMGKFEITDCQLVPPWSGTGQTKLLTLGHCIPGEISEFAENNSYFKSTVHYGRHGPQVAGEAVLKGLLKAPVMLAKPGAVFCSEVLPESGVFGRGMGGDGSISRRFPKTVVQGYAPYLRVFSDSVTASRKGVPA